MTDLEREHGGVILGEPGYNDAPPNEIETRHGLTGQPPEPQQQPGMACPECAAQGIERVFNGSRATQALGRHRSQLHGIKSKTELQREAKQRNGTTKRTPRAARAPRMVKPELNEKQLLKIVFPLGIPLDPEVMEETTAWIETARGLYAAK